MLELKNITKTFGNVVAPATRRFNPNQGTIHAIVGENGAGKICTIMRVAYGFYTADAAARFSSAASRANQIARRYFGNQNGASAFYVGER